MIYYLNKPKVIYYPDNHVEVIKEVIKEIEKPADKTPAGKVTNLTATTGDAMASLSWKNPDDEDLYGVEITVSEAESSYSFIVKKSVEAYVVYGLKNETEYTFSVKSIDNSLNLSEAESTKATPIDLSDKTPAGKVTNLIATPYDSMVSLSWKNPDDEDLYGVEITISDDKNSYSIVVRKPTEEYSVYGLINEKEYTFGVKSIDNSLNLSEAETTKATPIDLSDKTPPAEASEFTATETDSKITLSWTNPTDTDFSGVEISCEPKAGTLTNSIILKNDTTSLTVHGLTGGTTYTFTIKTFDTSGNFSTGTTCTVKMKIPLEGITINYEGQNDIKGLEHAISDESITFTAPANYKNYKWRLDNKLLETSEETPNSITIERTSLSGGVHSLMLIVNGMYSATCTITVKDGENFSDFSQVENIK